MKKKFIAGILFAASLSLGAGAWRQSARADDQNGYNADIPQMEGQSIEDEADDLYRSSLPQKYITDNLPKIKNQSPYGACWSFVMAALAEINVSRNGGNMPDYSEMHLVNFTYDGTTDPLGGFSGDSNYCGSAKGKLDIGCNYELAASSVANWKGYADESVLPYNIGNATAVENGEVDSKLAYDDTAHIRNFYLGDIVNDRDNVKELIQKYGAVGVDYYNKQSGYYNEATNSYYCNSDITGNHAVTIVGWDDNYSASDFSINPGENGAWLVRNSWGSVGDEYNYNGYFWMSYCDKSLDPTAIAVDCVTKADSDFYDNNYQYDGSIYSATCRTTAAANIFTAQKGYEQLKAISFVTDDTDEDYTIKIYNRLSDPTDPQSGTLVDTITGTTSYKGMYTIKLDKTVYVSKNDKYSVVIELTKHDGSRGAFRCETSGNISGIRFTASAAENTSFVLSKGSWVDVVNVNGIGNVRIKAYTDNMSGLIYADGKWNYYDNGVIKTDLTTLIKYNGNWFYLRGGTIDWGYTGLVKYNGNWFYVKSGKVDFSASTLCKYNGSWWYVRSGVVDFSKTTLVKYNGYWFYVKSGRVDFSAVTLIKYNGNWFYVKNGVVDFSGSTLCRYNGYWFYVKNGVVDFSGSTLCKYNGTWWYVKNGVVDFSATTLCKYKGTWFYVKKGAVDFKNSTLCKYNGNWYLVGSGVVSWNYSGKYKYNGNWFNIKGGIVRF